MLTSQAGTRPSLIGARASEPRGATSKPDLTVHDHLAAAEPREGRSGPSADGGLSPWSFFIFRLVEA